MTTKDKIQNAIFLEEYGEDGALYLQKVCSFEELTNQLAQVKRKNIKNIIESALKIKNLLEV